MQLDCWIISSSLKLWWVFERFHHFISLNLRCKIWAFEVFSYCLYPFALIQIPAALKCYKCLQKKQNESQLKPIWIVLCSGNFPFFDAKQVWTFFSFLLQHPNTDLLHVIYNNTANEALIHFNVIMKLYFVDGQLTWTLIIIIMNNLWPIIILHGIAHRGVSDTGRKVLCGVTLLLSCIDVTNDLSSSTNKDLLQKCEEAAFKKYSLF